MSDSRPASPSRFSKAAHLTEFYPYLINNNDNPTFPKAAPTTSHSRTQSISNTIGTINTTTTLQSILTKNDIQTTSAIYNEVLEACEDYKDGLSKVAETSANFGNALEKLAKLKGSNDINEDLLNVSGFFYLISNHQEILKQSIKQYFEIPINKEVNNFNLKISNNDESFKSEYKSLLKELKLKETENLRLSKSKNKNLNIYKSKLLQLTSHLDSIESLKQDYYAKSLELVESSNQKILNQLGTIIRAQVEIYESIARKGWSGGGLDELVAQSADPFNPDDDDILDHANGQRDEINYANDNDNDTLKQKFEQPDNNTPSPFSAIRINGGEVNNSYGNISLNPGSSDSDEEPRLGEPANIPRLNHQQSIRTLSQEYLQDQSTPIKDNTLTNPQEEEETLKNEQAIKQDAEGEQQVNKSIVALHLEDDNSFSLPIPGSSNTILNNEVEGKEDNKENEDEEEHEIEDIPDIKSKDLLEYADHNEWNE